MGDQMGDYQRLNSISDSAASDLDDGSGLDMASELAELHGTVSNIIIVESRGSESGYSSQEINTQSNGIDPIFQMYLTSNDKFKKVTIAVAHGIIHGEENLVRTLEIRKDSDEIKIYQTVHNLTEKMRRESPQHFETFVKRLKKAYESSNTVDPIVWFALSFEELIKKVGETPSWRTFANVINCIYIIKEVAKDNYNFELKKSMETCLINFIVDHFRLFITNCGGWENLVDYFKHVTTYDPLQESTGGVISAFVPIAIGLVSAVALLRR